MINLQRQTFSFGLFFGKLWDYRRMVGRYAGGLILVAGVFGSLTIMRTSISDSLKLIQLLAFFGLGFFNANALQGEDGSFLSRNYFFEYLLYTLLISCFICLLLSAVYYITNSNMRMALSSSFAFLVPFLLLQAWFFYKHIPKNAELIWTDSETTPDQLSLSFRNKIPVCFQLSRKYFDMQEIQFPVTVSSWVKLGILFHQFILEQSKDKAWEIELADDDGHEYGWEFYAESMGGFISRQLNPTLNVRENKINQNEAIVARRVRLVAEAEPDTETLSAEHSFSNSLNRP